MALGGRYARLFLLQAAAYVDGPIPDLELDAEGDLAPDPDARERAVGS
jgi:hypothetical protein